MAPRFTENHKALAFKDDKGRIHTGLELVVVEGIYDTEKHEYVDPPIVKIGYGNVRPDKVAEWVGIKDALK